MKKLLLALFLAVATLDASATQKVISQEFFARRIVSPDGKTIVLAYGQTHQYVKIINDKKQIVEIDGKQFKFVMFAVAPQGRLWRLNLIYNK